MESPKTKRVRNCNWDEEEKKLLRQLVLERIDIIENKNTSTNTNAAKKSSWEEILTCFNTINSKKRDMVQLVNQWRSTKNKLKSADFEYRRARGQTGGGPPPPSPSAEDVAVMAAIPHEFVVDVNMFDSDSLHTLQKSEREKDVESRANAEPSLHPPQSSFTEDIAIIAVTPAAELVVDSNLVDFNSQHKYQKSEKRAGSTAGPSNDYKPIKIRKNVKQNIDFEKELFLLSKRAKERAMEREEELHKKKLEVLEIEKQYWIVKIKKAAE